MDHSLFARSRTVRERVSVLYGRAPVILVAPHGFDDSYTDIMTEEATITCGGNAIINRGWERSSSVDVLNDKANCNSYEHCQHNVVKDEFFDPLERIQNQLLAKHQTIFVFHIHGCGNNVRAQVSHPLHFVIGAGAGKPNRLTCTSSALSLFAWIWKQTGWEPGKAEIGSKFAGWGKDNLLQMWANCAPMIQAMQLEFVTATRSSKSSAETHGAVLGNMINTFMVSYGKVAPPPNYQPISVNV